MNVRPETPRDHAAIQAINIDAFASHPFSQQTEHLIVNALRDANALTVSLVADEQGEVLGHIAFSPALIDGVVTHHPAFSVTAQPGGARALLDRAAQRP